MKTQIDDSKYLKPFQRVLNEYRELLHLKEDVMLVEKITGQEYKKEIKGEDGKLKPLYLVSGSEKKVDGLDMNLPMFVRVLATGPGWFDEEGNSVNLDCEPGDIILVGRMSVNWFSVFGSLVSTSSGEIGLTREREVQMKFKGQDGYNKFFSALNDELSSTKGC